MQMAHRGQSPRPERERAVTRSKTPIIIAGVALMTSTVVLLLLHLWTNERAELFWAAGLLLTIALAEIVFWKRVGGSEKSRRL